MSEVKVEEFVRSLSAQRVETLRGVIEASRA